MARIDVKKNLSKGQDLISEEELKKVTGGAYITSTPTLTRPIQPEPIIQPSPIRIPTPIQCDTTW